MTQMTKANGRKTNSNNSFRLKMSHQIYHLGFRNQYLQVSLYGMYTLNSQMHQRCYRWEWWGGDGAWRCNIRPCKSFFPHCLLRYLNKQLQGSPYMWCEESRQLNWEWPKKIKKIKMFMATHTTCRATVIFWARVNVEVIHLKLFVVGVVNTFQSNSVLEFYSLRGYRQWKHTFNECSAVMLA